MATIIRDRLPPDLPILAQVLQSLYQTDGYPVEGPLSTPEALSFIDPPEPLRVWAALYNSQIVGQAVVTPGSRARAGVAAYVERGGDESRVGFLGRLFVGGEGRSKGIGRALVVEAMQWAESEGLILVLDVMEKDGRAAKLYERLGWRRIGEGWHDDGKGGKWRRWSYVSPEPKAACREV